MPYIDLGQVVGAKGDQGNVGPRGLQGVQGPAGPNEVTGSTSTPLSGILQGNGSYVQALPSDSAPTADSNNAIRSGAVYNALTRKPNRNLFRNPYFIGGGSQQGAGIFPVNQRGLTNYSTTGYTIDRWSMGTATHSLTLNADSVRWKRESSGGNPKFSQPYALQVGQTYTLSVLYKGDFRWLGFTPGNAYIAPSDTFTLATATFTATQAMFEVGASTVACGLQDFSFYNNIDDIGHYVDIQAIKLEVGSQQTLARLDNGTWILNEIPDFGDEFAACQRYLIRPTAWNDIYPARTDGTNLYFFIPRSMAKTPADVSSLQVYVYFGTTASNITGTCTFARTETGIRGAIPRGALSPNSGGTMAFASAVNISAE